MLFKNGFDGTLALLIDPYRFIAKRCHRRRADIFETRLLSKKTICMSGKNAAELFYDENRFIRQDAAPHRLTATLFGKDGVQSLDGSAHRHRKRMLMSLMLPQHVARLSDIVNQRWRVHALRWATLDRVQLYREVQKIFLEAVCLWGDVPLVSDPDQHISQIEKRTRQITALFDGAGAVGLKYWRSRFARKETENWLREIIEKTRAELIGPAVGTALHTIAWHRDENDILLPVDVAAVELLNIVRPTVAVSVYIVFIAHALHQYPHYAQEFKQLKYGSEEWEEYATCFVHEVRRFYPFFPMTVARARDAFTWRGQTIARDERVMLDLYGTNHDKRLWYAPDEFRPKRFIDKTINAYSLIPQGGGNHQLSHRCAGEWITIELMKGALHFLTSQISYVVPPQNLSIRYTRLPALPKSGFVVSRVQPLF